MNRHKRVNFISVVIVTVASMLFALFGHGLLRTLFALPLVAVLPGYAAMAAWFPKRLTKYPGNVLFVITLSLCITSLMGLVLNATPWGINLQTWVASLGGLTLINLVIGLLIGDFSLKKPQDKPIKVPFYQVTMIGAAIVISFMAIGFAREGIKQQSKADVSQLWMIPVEDSNAFHMGMTNHDDETVSYKLIIKDGSRTIEETFELKPGETWENDYTLPGGAVREVNAYLSRLDKPHLVYRSTSLWLPHTE